MPGCLDAEGLEWIGEVTEVTALWGEGIGRNSHTLKLQELGGYCERVSSQALHSFHAWPRTNISHTWSWIFIDFHGFC